MRQLPRTLAQQSAALAFRTFFALIKACIVALVLIVVVLVAGQSTVAPVSMRLLMTYTVEYAVTYFKPYRSYFPEPYVLHIQNK